MTRGAGVEKSGSCRSKEVGKGGKEWKGKASKRGKDRVRAGAGQRLYATTVSVCAQEMHTTEGIAGED